MIKSFNSVKPKIDSDVYISENASIIGNVVIKKDSSIWFGSVLRADVGSIHIGSNTNIQDNTVIHVSKINGNTEVGSNVTVGHRALIHACTIHDYGFIGMGAIVMDCAIIEEFGFVAAGALISPDKVVKSRELWAGVPAKCIRKLTDEDIELIRKSAKDYTLLSKKYITNAVND